MSSLTSARPARDFIARFRPSKADSSRPSRRLAKDGDGATPDATPPSAQRPRPRRDGASVRPAPGPGSPSNADAGTDVVLYRPSQIISPPRPTRRRDALLQRADTGDVEARLELMTPSAVEAALARHRRPDSDRTLLEYLQTPDRGLSRAEAAARVLNELGDRTEQTSVECVLVWRYIQLHNLWETHVNPTLRSADAFLDNLDQDALVKINLVVGTSTQAERNRKAAYIEARWGADWFDRIPRDLLPPDATTPHGLSKRVLIEIAANCKKGVELPAAVEAWRERVDARRAKAATTANRPHRWAHLVPEDIAPLNRRLDHERGRRTAALFFPELREDRLELLPTSTAVDTAAKAKPTPTRSRAKNDAQGKRKRMEGEEGEAADEAEPARRISADGKYYLKRVGRQLIREPIRPDSPVESQTLPLSTPAVRKACLGADVHGVLSRLVSECEKLFPLDDDFASFYCEDCLEPCTKLKGLVQCDLAAVLASIASHEHGTSGLAQGGSSQDGVTLFVTDSGDDD